MPLLFNICAKAQTVTAVRAIESATQTLADKQTESVREVLITLESLREQTFRIVMDWPSFINETVDSQLLSHISSGINQLMQTLEPTQVLNYQGKAASHHKHNQEQWAGFSNKLSQSIFGCSAQDWLEHNIQKDQLDNWASKEQTQAAKFIHWLNQKQWKHLGKSTITHIPEIKDSELLALLVTQGHEFTAQPSWNNQCYELSWFSRKQGLQKNNDIYSRMVTRLKDIADLIIKLDTFYIKETHLEVSQSSVSGMAHSEAARGRLTHFIDVENDTINKLVILAPTEWNFHPEGVAAKSLNDLDASSPHELRQQAELLIHAIDPCVGYHLNIAGLK
jgi:coenzyme F420-reducing hydrogenase alpha subunit